MAEQTMDESITKNCSGSSRNSNQVMYGIHFKIIGNCIRRNITPEMKIKLRNLGNLRKNVRQVVKMTGKLRCQMEMRLMILRKHV
jgi:hypothetical protein